MSAIWFDSHQIVKRLLSAGFTPSQAETMVEAARDATVQLTTRRDLDDLRKELKSDMAAMELRLVIKLGGMTVLAVGVLAAIIKLL
jgi:cytochrome P450